MLAAAYVLQLEDLARDVSELNIAAGIAAAFGGQLARVAWEDALDGFDADLAAPPTGTGSADRSARGIKLRALGVE